MFQVRQPVTDFPHRWPAVRQEWNEGNQFKGKFGHNLEPHEHRVIYTPSTP